MTKTCKICKKEKDIREFYEHVSYKDGRMNVCKECHKERVKRSNTKPKEKAKYMRSRAFIDSLKTPCVKCGEDRGWVIQFHHLDNKAKTFNIGSIGQSKESILEEVEKCVCLCANCHKEFHYFFGNNPKKPIEAYHKFINEEY